MRICADTFRFWLSLLAFASGFRFWLSLLAFASGFRFWLSLLAFASGFRFWRFRARFGGRFWAGIATRATATASIGRGASAGLAVRHAPADGVHMAEQLIDPRGVLGALDVRQAAASAPAQRVMGMGTVYVETAPATPSCARPLPHGTLTAVCRP
jgi:hypothetical protein